nr:cell division cycle-associated protein 2-like [Pogona vitticeps]XP_020668235.1 cell division cycle-associated protein 2-like [Pogona vitticeps]
MQCSLSVGHEDNISFTKKMDCSTISYCSSASDINTSTDTFLFPKGGEQSHAGSPLTGDQPATLDDTSYLTPVKMKSEPDLNYEVSTCQTPPPVDFSTVTVADFGISPAAFTKQSKGASKSLINKFKRRSTIGVRGSPENNSLIRYIAHQRRVRKQNTLPEANPFIHQNTLLKAKIAAFQSSFKPLEEIEEKGIHISDTPKEANTTPYEPSKHGQVLTSGCKKIALEDDINHKAMNGDRISAGIQTSTFASPSEKALLVGTVAISKAVPVQSVSSVESGCMHLEYTPQKEASKTECGRKTLCANEELSRDVSYQNSCKKVRFAEEQRLEIFDTTKAPVTPLQSCLPSSSLRSALKKMPVKTVKILPEGMTEHLHDPGREGGTELLSNLNNCELLQTERSIGAIEEVKQCKKELDSDISDKHLPVDIPACREDRVPLSPSGSTEEDFPHITPIKQSFSQPNFDDDDKDQGSLEEVVRPECSTSPDLQETKNSSPDLQATYTRITRSCTKVKRVSEREKINLSPAKKPQAKKNLKRKSSGNENASPTAKSSHKKTPAKRQKVFGKRRKKKKEQKALYGPREIVSKMPPLSPIPEAKEELSMVSSHQSTPTSHRSILDDSSANLLHAKSLNGPAENGVLCFDEGNNNCLDLPNGEDLVTSPPSQLHDGAANDMKKIVPLDSPENSSLEKQKCALHENKLVLKNDCTSNEAEMQRVPEVLNLSGMDQNSKAKGVLPFAVGSERDPMRGKDAVDFKRFPRRSRRLTCYRSSVEAFQSETPGDDVAENNTEELPPVADDPICLKNLECSVEDRSRHVRRSMRQHKDTENKGLVWIQIPDNNMRGQAPLNAPSKAKRRKSFGPQGSELLHQMQIHCVPGLFPRNEEQENAHVVTGPREPKRRRNSMCVLSPKENENVLRVQRNRRASLGYRSDLCYRKDYEARTFFKNQPVV